MNTKPRGEMRWESKRRIATTISIFHCLERLARDGDDSSGKGSSTSNGSVRCNIEHIF